MIRKIFLCDYCKKEKTAQVESIHPYFVICQHLNEFNYFSYFQIGPSIKYNYVIKKF